MVQVIFMLMSLHLHSKKRYLVSSSTITMGSSRWPGARKLYCRSLCFVKPVVNTYWEGKYNYFEKLSKDRIVNRKHETHTKPFFR